MQTQNAAQHSEAERYSGESTSLELDDETIGSSLVAHAVERAIDRPVHRSYGMRVVEDLVESALFSKLEDQDMSTQALREAFVRSMIDGLCNVAVKRTATKVRAAERQSNRVAVDARRSSLSRSVANDAVEGVVSEVEVEMERAAMSRDLADTTVDSAVTDSEIEDGRRALSRLLADHTLEAAITDSEVEQERLHLSRYIANDTIDTVVMDQSSRIISKSLRNTSQRRQRHRSLAAIKAQREAAANAAEKTYAARVLQRWVRDRKALEKRRLRKLEGKDDDAGYGVYLVQQWTADRAAQEEERKAAAEDEAAAQQEKNVVDDQADAAADDEADDEGGPEEEEDYCTVEPEPEEPPKQKHVDAESPEAIAKRQMLERQRWLIAKWMPIRHPPRFRSDGAAQAFMGRVLALSREERISRADFQNIYLAVMDAIHHIWFLLQSRADVEADERNRIHREEHHARADVVAEYAMFVEAAHYTAWSIRYGEQSAEGFETICRAVAEAETADRQVLFTREREGFDLLWRTRPKPSSRVARRLGTAIRSSHSSLGSALDDAHSSVERSTTAPTRTRTSPTKASTAPSKASLARSELTAHRIARAEVIRGQNATMEALHTSAMIIQQNSLFEKTSERRQQTALHKAVIGQRRAEELERRRTQTRLEALDRHYASQLRHAQPEEAAAIQRSLQQIRLQSPPRTHTAVDQPRWMSGVDRPRTSQSSSHPGRSNLSGGSSSIGNRSATPATAKAEYSTAGAYGQKPPKSAPPASRPPTKLPPVQPAPVKSNASALSTSTASRRQVPVVAFPVERQLHDQMLTLATVVEDFAVSSQRLFMTCRTPMPHGFRTAGRLHAAAQADAAQRENLFAVDLIELSPRSRIARWNIEVSDLLADGDTQSAAKVHATVKHEIAVFEKNLAKSKSSNNRGSPPGAAASDDGSSSYAVVNLKCAYESNCAAFARSEGRVGDALRHLQRKMEAEEAMALLSASATAVDPSSSMARRRPLSTEAGSSFESLLSASALLTTLGEAVAALQYARAASRIVSAAVVRLEDELRRAASLGYWADDAQLSELRVDTERLGKAAALALHNTAMAQLSCAPSTRKGERLVSPATFRACIDVASTVVGPTTPFTERLRQSAAHFASAGAATAQDADETQDWSAIEHGGVDQSV